MIALAAVAAYSNSLSVPLFFDDAHAIKENPTIRKLASIATVLSPPRDGGGVSGRPVINLSIALDYAFFGTRVEGYHWTNLLIHACSGVILFGLIRRCLLAPTLGERFGPEATLLAFAASLLWTLHPLQTESVTCVIQRTELIVGFFYLTTLYCFMRSEDSGSPRAWQAAAVLACLLGMASKEVMVSAPLLVLLLDWTLVSQSLLLAWRRRRAMYLGLAATWILLCASLISLGGARGAAAGFGLGVPWWAYALTQCEAIVLYLKLSLWPNPLVLDYGTGVVTSILDVLPQGLLLVALVAGTVFATRVRPAVGFLGVFFFAVLAPSSSVVPLVAQTMAEHRMYLPLAAVITVGVGASYVAARERGLWALLVLAVALGFVTYHRNEAFHDEISIWTDTLAKKPQSIRVRVSLANALSDLGKSDEALVHYREALRLAPDQADAWNGIGAQLIALGRPREAREPCELALKYRPFYAEAHTNLGSALCAEGNFAEAQKHFEAAIALKPFLASAHADLAGLLVQQQSYAEAIAHCEIAIRENPRIPEAFFNLARAQAHLGRPAAAAVNFARTIQLNSNYAAAESDWGAVLVQQNQFAEALPHFLRATALDPKSIEARSNLGTAYFHLEQLDEAIVNFREAIRLNPDAPESHANLALAFTRTGRLTEAIAECETTLRLQPNYAGARDNLAYLHEVLKNNAGKKD